MVTQGYADALRYLGWTVIVRKAQWKQEVRKIIEQYDVRMIFTCCKYGLRQLPISVINQRGIVVVVRALMFNKENIDLGGTTECVDPTDPYLVQSIERKIVHTKCDIRMLGKYYHRWGEIDEPLIVLKNAGNLLRATPKSMAMIHDISMVMNLRHRQDVVATHLDPLLNRLKGRYRFNCYGDSVWQGLGIPARHLDEGHKHVATIYGQSLVCPNLHTSPQRLHSLSINERTFSIALAGGNQVCDNPLVPIEFGDLIDSDSTPSGFVQLVERHLCSPDQRFDRTRKLVEFTTGKHTYFHRLRTIFEILRMKDWIIEVDRAIARVGRTHLAEIDKMIHLAKQGVVYERQEESLYAMV
jgi:hypothetical protein